MTVIGRVIWTALLAVLYPHFRLRQASQHHGISEQEILRDMTTAEVGENTETPIPAGREMGRSPDAHRGRPQQCRLPCGDGRASPHS